MKIIFDKKDAEEIFFTALCNGLDYVSGYGMLMETNADDYLKAKDSLDESACYEDILMQILRDGNKLTLVDYEGDEEQYSITLDDVYRGMPYVPIDNVLNIIAENDDAIDADVVLQTIFFNEMIFG